MGGCSCFLYYRISSLKQSSGFVNVNNLRTTCKAKKNVAGLATANAAQTIDFFHTSFILCIISILQFVGFQEMNDRCSFSCQNKHWSLHSLSTVLDKTDSGCQGKGTVGVATSEKDSLKVKVTSKIFSLSLQHHRLQVLKTEKSNFLLIKTIPSITLTSNTQLFLIYSYATSWLIFTGKSVMNISDQTCLHSSPDLSHFHYSAL